MLSYKRTGKIVITYFLLNFDVIAMQRTFFPSSKKGPILVLKSRLVEERLYLREKSVRCLDDKAVPLSSIDGIAGRGPEKDPVVVKSQVKTILMFYSSKSNSPEVLSYYSSFDTVEQHIYTV